MPDNSLGLIMILKDEEANLGRSLAPVAGLFDEVVVVDTGSRDATAGICRDLGARVYHFDWIDDFAAARNEAINLATADWLFWLDGDNAVEPQGVAHLRASLPKEGPAVLWATERVIPSGQELWQKRCFANHPRARFQGRVHEQLEHPRDWPSIFTKLVVRHWGYVDPDHVAQTGRYYLKLLNQMLEDNPGDFYSHFQAARCLLNLRDFAGAEAHFQALFHSAQAKERNRGLWVYGVMLWAQLKQNQGDPAGSLALLDETLAAEPDLGLLHYQRGRASYALGQWQQAIGHLQKCLQLGLGAPVVDLDQKGALFMASFFLARSLEKLGQTRQARQAYEHAIAMDPQNPSARTGLAALLIADKDFGPARPHLEYVLQIQHDDPTALRLLKRCEAA